MLELKKYASRPVKAVQVIDVNEDGTELFGLLKNAEETIKFTKYTRKLPDGTTEPAVKMTVLVGRGRWKSWRVCHNGDWILEEHDGATRVFRDRSFRNTFTGPID